VRKGLLRRIHPQDPDLGRVEQNVAEAFNATADQVNVTAVPVTRLSVTSVIAAGVAIITFAGVAGQVLTLPPAAAQGDNVGTVIYVMNLSTVAVTLARGGADTVNGGASMSLAAGKLGICVSDGMTAWKVATS